MNLSRCEKGHFYDKEKFATCPHCAGGSANDDSLTTVFTEDATEPLNAAPQAAPAFTPAFTPQAAPTPAPQPVFSAPPVPPTAEPGLPVADMSANSMTIAFDNGMDSPTVPLDDIINNQAPVETVDEDDDHTVGFFDEDIFTGGSTNADHTAPVNAQAKVLVNKVSTPCVGWLVAIGGAHIGTDFRLKVGKNFIGRSPQMDVALTEDKSVSRDRQAIVVYEPKEHLYLVQPGEASTLVYKNEQVVLSPEKLEAYDVITVGEVNLLFIPLCNKEFNWNQILDEMKNKA